MVMLGYKAMMLLLLLLLLLLPCPFQFQRQVWQDVLCGLRQTTKRKDIR